MEAATSAPDQLLAQALVRLGEITSLDQLESLSTEYLGRKGHLAACMQVLGSLPPEQRRDYGRQVNEAKSQLTEALELRRAELRRAEGQARLQAEAIDITRPGRVPELGRPHPLTQTFDQVSNTLVGLGFRQVHGPEVESFQHNFGALNFHPEHPALDDQASFYVDDRLLLRTQTTALQGRVMPQLKPPFRIFTLGRCFRYEAVDATHYHTFHQVDAFTVDRRLALTDLKGTLGALCRELFGSDVEVRFRPDFFPFVEPGVEIAVKLRGRWLELGGAGMIHPNVLRNVGIDPTEWSGFAFGLGLDRMPMVAHGITDIRLLFENDLRMLRQF